MRLGIILIVIGLIALVGDTVWTHLQINEFLRQVEAGVAREFPGHTSWPFLFGLILFVAGWYLVYESYQRRRQ